MVNPLEFVGGAGLGTVCSLLCEGIKELIDKNHMFSPLLEEIQSKLKCLAPLIPQMSQSNLQLSYANNAELGGLEAVMKEGNDLVVKCGKLSQWNPFKRFKYANRLIGWKDKFETQSIVMRVQQSRDVKMTAVGVQTIEVSVGNLTEEVKDVKILTKKIEFSTEKLEVSTEKLEVSVGNLTDELKNFKVEVNQTNSAAFKAWSAVPELPPHPVGLDVPLKELKKKFLWDDGVSMFVVMAFGGCGKTTLVSKFCLDGQVKDKFNNNIFFVTISKNPKMNLIVQQLYQQKGEKPPDFASEESAAILLSKFLKEEGKRPLLLVLDDVWSGSEPLLEMFNLRMPNYKVLVTSTSQFEGFGPKYEVQLLDDKNAMELFHHSASLGDESSHISKDCARKIVERCNGLPLAIRVVGLSLRGKPEPFWIRKETECSNGFSIFDPYIQSFGCLQSSVDELDKQSRKCFLDLGAFPQSKYIPVATLFDMWAELYDLHDDNLCIAYLYELSTRSLANLVDRREDKMEAEGYYSQHFVVQHNLLRELAIYLSKEDKEEDRRRLKEEDRSRLMIEICGDKRPKWWSKQKCRTMQARLLSISTDGKFSMEWPDMQLPKAKVLVLNFQTKDYSFPKFVDQMHKLKLLVVTCDDFFDSGAALSSFQPLNQLTNLKTIILVGISIPSIAKNPIELKSVKKISLSRCYEVSEAFRDDSVKISDFFPKLEEMNIDFCNLVELPADLGHLTFLRELNITNCCGLSTLPEGMEKLVDLEVLRLRFCRDFSKFQHSIKLKRLKSLDLAYCSSMEELPKYIGELSSLRKLDTRNCPALNELPPSISDLKQLKVVICSYKTKFLTEALPYGKNIPMDPRNLNWNDFCPGFSLPVPQTILRFDVGKSVH